MIFETTPSQTVGPYFAIGLPFDVGPFVVPEGTSSAIRLTGTIYDGAGIPIPDFLLETWQADSDGRFADMHDHGGHSEQTGFRGFARYKPAPAQGCRRSRRLPPSSRSPRPDVP